MANQNWNSKQSECTPIRKRSTKEKAMIACTLYRGGHKVQYISEHMEMSKSRIYEYVRGVKVVPDDHCLDGPDTWTNPEY